MNTGGNRIHVRVEPELTPIRLEDRRMGVHAEIDVKVNSRLTGLGILGVFAISLGALLLLVACLTFAFGYPEKYHARGDITEAESDAFIELVVLSAAAGVILLFLGTSMFFYGRTVLGSGMLDRYSSLEPIEEGT